MPTHSGLDGGHRTRTTPFQLPWFVAVARKVKRDEVLKTPMTRAAVDDELHELEQRPHSDGDGVGAWDYDSVRESPDARRG